MPWCSGRAPKAGAERALVPGSALFPVPPEIVPSGEVTKNSRQESLLASTALRKGVSKHPLSFPKGPRSGLVLQNKERVTTVSALLPSQMTCCYSSWCIGPDGFILYSERISTVFLLNRRRKLLLALPALRRLLSWRGAPRALHAPHHTPCAPAQPALVCVIPTTGDGPRLPHQDLPTLSTTSHLLKGHGWRRGLATPRLIAALPQGETLSQRV